MSSQTTKKRKRKRGAPTLHQFIMREAAVCGRMKPRPLKRRNTEKQEGKS